MSELCDHYGVSRESGYKWARRYREEGEAGLEERSRRPLHCPHQTPAHVEALILGLQASCSWGSRKLLSKLRDQLPPSEVPARSTVFDVLKRHGLVKPRRRRQKWAHPGAVPLRTDAPNQVWSIDFKGHFRMRNGIYCYPLTVMDHFSRYLLGCKALLSTKAISAKAALQRIFQRYGLPDAIRSDNGTPFASTGFHGLCAMNAWWMKLGIVHQRITPASPQENGVHERMHRTLKADTTRPPGSSCAGQQHKFDRFQHLYNQDRPHEALDDRTPASVWTPSLRPYPSYIAPPEYPGHFEIRRVSNKGTFRIHSGQHFLSHALSNEYIGLEEVDDGLWNIAFYNTLLGRIDQRSGLLTGATSRRK